MDAETTERPASKVSHIGVPAVFKLELACKHLNAAYGDHFGCYIVGSALERPDWRDVDVVLIMDDAEFAKEFPRVRDVATGVFEFDTKWLLNSVSISAWLSEQTGLPVDFKIQPQTWANKRHGRKRRHAVGLTFSAPT